MAKTQEEIIELIRQCLALSENNPSEGEAASALAHAQALLQKYNLDMADISKRLDKEAPGLTNFPLQFERNLPEWKLWMIRRISDNNFCHVVSSGKTKVYILGQAGNIQCVLEMSLWIINQVEGIAWSSTHIYEGRDRIAYRNSFIWTCIQRVNKRIQDQRSSWQASSSQATALVLYSKEELSKFVHQQFPSLINVSHFHANSSSQGQKDGWNAGAQISISSPRSQIE